MRKASAVRKNDSKCLSNFAILALLQLTFFYADLGTDIGFAAEPYRRKDEVAIYGNFFYAVVVFMVTQPVLVSIIDVAEGSKGGMGWFGALLNFSFMRVLHSTATIFLSEDKTTAKAAVGVKAHSNLFLRRGIVHVWVVCHLRCVVPGAM